MRSYALNTTPFFIHKTSPLLRLIFSTSLSLSLAMLPLMQNTHTHTFSPPHLHKKQCLQRCSVSNTKKKTPDAREREMQRVGAKIMHTYLYLLTASFFSSLIIIMHSEPALCLCLCAGAAYNTRGEERKRILSVYASCAHGTFSHIIIW